MGLHFCFANFKIQKNNIISTENPIKSYSPFSTISPKTLKLKQIKILLKIIFMVKLEGNNSIWFVFQMQEFVYNITIKNIVSDRYMFTIHINWNYNLLAMQFKEKRGKSSDWVLKVTSETRDLHLFTNIWDINFRNILWIIISSETLG